MALSVSPFPPHKDPLLTRYADILSYQHRFNLLFILHTHGDGIIQEGVCVKTKQFIQIM